MGVAQVRGVGVTMQDPYTHLPADIARALARYHRRQRLYRTLSGIALLAIVWAVLALVVSHVDRFAFLDTAARQSMSWAGNGLVLLAAAAYLIRYATARLDLRRLAYDLEGRIGPEAGERIVTVESLYRRGDPAGRPELLAQVRNEAETLARDLDSAALVREPRLRRRGIALGILVVLGAVLWMLPGYQFGLMLERYLFPGRNLPKPSFVQLTIEHEEVVGRGGEVVIQVTTEGRIPAVLAPVMRWFGAETGRCLLAIGGPDAMPRFTDDDTITMSRIQRNLFIATRNELSEDFTFRVRTGDAQSAALPVRVVAQPVLTTARLHLVHPAYTRMGEETVVDLTQPLALLPGTEVTLELAVDQDDARVELQIQGVAEPVSLERDADGRIRHSFAFTEATVLEPQAVNPEGFSNVDRTRIRLGLREDRKPAVRLTAPGRVVDLLPGELVPIQVDAEDDFGLTAAAVQYRINPHLDDDAPIEEAVLASFDEDDQQERSRTITGNFDLGELPVVPGDELTLQVRVRDTAGNDGMSRPVLVRIVALTRGEHERRRIEALSAAVAALGELVGKSAVPPTLPSAAAEALQNAIESLNLALDTPVDLAAVLALLEREHHLTRSQAAKRDLRVLMGALRAMQHGPPATLYAPLEQLQAVLRYRRLANATWRLFGMRAEAVRIQGVLEELAAMPELDEDAVRALRRRTALYLEVLQDVGDEILAAAEITPSLDQKTILDIQGELNTAAYYLKRGSLAKNQASAETVLALLDRMLDLVVPTLPPRLGEAVAARADLAAAHRARRALIASVGGEAARTWIAGEQAALDREPLVALWPRLEALAIAVALDAGEDIALPALREDLAATIAADRAAARDHQFRVTKAGLQRDVPAGLERDLAIALVHLEHAHAVGDRGRIAEVERAIAAGTPEAVGPAELGVAEPAGLRYAERGLIPGPVAATRECAQRVHAALDATRALAESASAGTVPPAAELDALVVLLQRLERGFDRARRAIALHLSDLEPGAASARADEVLLLKVQRAGDRFQLRSRRDRAPIEHHAADAGGAAQARDLARAATRLVTTLESLAGQVDGYLIAHGDGSFLDPTERARLPRLERYLLTDRLLLAADTVTREASPEVIQGFLAALPQAADRYLLSQGDRLAEAASALSAAHAALELDQDDADVAAYARSRARAESALATFADAVERTGSEDLIDTFGPGIEALRNRVDRLALASDVGDERVRQVIYGLQEASREVARLRNRLDGIGVDDGLGPREWRGGPAGLWSDDRLRRDAEKRREQLGALAELCETQAILGIVAGLDGAADPAARQWARTLHRMWRSPLSGQASERTTGGGEVEADPLVIWLAEQARIGLRQSDLETYPAATRLYLQSLLDRLRY